MAEKAGQEPKTALDLTVEEERVFVASQWQLVWWRFRKHRMAVASGIVLLICYALVVFADFFGPYDPRRRDVDHTYAPPQRLYVVDTDGDFHLRPFTFSLEKSMDLESLRVTYAENHDTMYPLRFFVHGEPYKLMGLFDADLRLFGVDEGGTILLLGADGLGRDYLSRIIHGGRVSLSIGLVGIAISFFLGILIGGLSGYYGGLFDLLVQRLIELIKGIPRLPLWMVLSTALPPKWPVTYVYFGIVVILSLIGWTGLARVIRGKFMSLREEDFVMSARLVGANELRIVFRHMVPSFASHLIASVTMSVPGMILGETSLSFLGLGLRAPAISWGVLLSEAQAISVLFESPWLLWAGFPIVIVVLAYNFVGDGIRDAADPYSR